MSKTFFLRNRLWLGLGLCVLGQITVSAQTPRQNSLGVPLVPIPGTSVSFAAWETRVSDWIQFAEGTGQSLPAKPPFAQTPDHPIVLINLPEAQKFCSWLTSREQKAGLLKATEYYRLPTHREWEAAVGLPTARSGTNSFEEKTRDARFYPWGTQWPPPQKFGNYQEQHIQGYQDGYAFTAPAGSYKPTAEGVYDLGGNVWEWAVETDGSGGALRGGSWAYFRPVTLNASYRYIVPPELKATTIGFRCVLADSAAVPLATVNAVADKQRLGLNKDSQVSDSAVQAMMKKLQNEGNNSGDSSKAQGVAVKGKPFTNSLQLDFLPMGDGHVLAGITEVRVRDFEKWIQESGHSWDRKPSFYTNDRHPAAGMTWEAATEFCAWLTRVERAAGTIPATATYRLPTDVEWSGLAGLKDEAGKDPSARHLGQVQHFPWSREGQWPPLPDTVNLNATDIPGYRDNYAYTCAVKTMPANGYGFYELGGNVAEWCADVWPGSADHVVRGGSWLSSSKEVLLTSARAHVDPGAARPDIGFRIVLEIGQ